MHQQRNMRHQRIVWALSVIAATTLAWACLGPEGDLTPQEQEIPQGQVSVTLMSGETIQVDASKICWNTRTPIPQGHKVVAGPKANQVLFVPEGGEAAAAYVPPDGSVTCSCDTGPGGCSPATIEGGWVACVMTSCSTCTRTVK
jgi:hypothetical protein